MAGEKFNFWAKKPGGITGTEIWPIQGASGAPGDNWSLDAADMVAFTKSSLASSLPTLIGTSEVDTNVGAAVAAGKSGIFVLTSNVSESGSTSLLTGNEAPIYIFSNGKFTWNLNTRAFSYRALKHIFVDVINANFSDNNVLSKTYIYGTSVTIVSSNTYYINHSGCSVTVPNAQCFCNYSLFENNL